jgi:hypothetical protein
MAVEPPSQLKGRARASESTLSRANKTRVISPPSPSGGQQPTASSGSNSNSSYHPSSRTPVVESTSTGRARDESLRGQPPNQSPPTTRSISQMQQPVKSSGNTRGGMSFPATSATGATSNNGHPQRENPNSEQRPLRIAMPQKTRLDTSADPNNGSISTHTRNSNSNNPTTTTEYLYPLQNTMLDDEMLARAMFESQFENDDQPTTTSKTTSDTDCTPMPTTVARSVIRNPHTSTTTRSSQNVGARDSGATHTTTTTANHPNERSRMQAPPVMRRSVHPASSSSNSTVPIDVDSDAEFVRAMHEMDFQEK